MKTARKIAALALAFLLTSSGLVGALPAASGGGIGYMTVTVTYAQTEARKILPMINELRADGNAWYWNKANSEKIAPTGLRPLTYDYRLEEIAMLRAAELSERASHTRPDGTMFRTAFDDTYVLRGENTAYWCETVEEAFRVWCSEGSSYSDQAERRRMLSADFESVGIGHAVDGDQNFWVLLLGSPSSGAPEVPPAEEARAVRVAKLIEDRSDSWQDPFAQNSQEGGYTYTVSDGGAKIVGVDEGLSGQAVLPRTLGGYPVTGIGPWAFRDCENIESIRVPGAVLEIAPSAFGDCPALKSIEVEESSAVYRSDDGILFSADGSVLVRYPQGRLDAAEYSVPDGVKTVGAYAFYQCGGLSEVRLPESVTEIGVSAFNSSGIRHMIVPASVETIGRYAFSDCRALKDMVLLCPPSALGSDIVTVFSYVVWKMKYMYCYFDRDGWEEYTEYNSYAEKWVDLNDVPEDGMSLDRTSAELNAGETVELTARISPLLCADPVWSSSDPSVATVSPDGVVSAVGAGTATISVSNGDGAFSARCEIRVEGQAAPPETEPPETEPPETEPLETEPPETEPTGPDKGFALGDVNMDGKINSQDARLALRAAAKTEALSDLQSLLADVSMDGKVKAADARTILRIAAKLEPAPDVVIRPMES